MPLLPTQIGRAAEYLVCHILECNGIEAHHLNSTTDVLAVVASGRVIRLEVKASNPKGDCKSYRFLSNNNGRSDYYAFVAFDQGRVIFMPSDRVVSKSMTIAHDQFTPERQHATLAILGELT
jgi:hypothetical protein